MKLHCARWAWLAALAAALFSLAACDRREATPAATPAAESSGTPNAAVKPQPAEVPAASTTGPAGGGTAIGGMAASPESGGKADSSKAPAPTGGDGAASAPAAAASK
ncbi:MAG TPA: hypothetical protein VHQ87_01850 [Rhizobacter sp.]|jgi:hypothetical protein|nr:hypothetical protein [Rhizobacter sp.]